MDAPFALYAPPADEPATRVLPRVRTVMGVTPVLIAVPPAPPPVVASAAALAIDVAALRAAWEAEHEAEVEARLDAARAEAAAEATATARAEMEAVQAPALDALRDALLADMAGLHAAWGRFTERVEGQLVGLALDAATAVLDAPPSEAAREATRRAVAHAAEALGASADRVTVRLHPVALLRFQECGLTDGLAGVARSLRWAPDESMSEDDWVVESPESIVRHVRAELLDGLRARLDLLATPVEVPAADLALPAAPPPTALPVAHA
ncbi:MAG TPA: hypothetical protein VK610_01190 [Rhodothermales bacterium]|nr:hypothetical protein [Rhodothermales bacterium]